MTAFGEMPIFGPSHLCLHLAKKVFRGGGAMADSKGFSIRETLGSGRLISEVVLIRNES